MKNKTKIQLIEGEEIYIQTKGINDKFYLLVGPLIGVGGFIPLVLSIYYLLAFSSLLGFIGSLIIAIACFSAFVYFLYERIYSSKTSYYITSVRAIKFIDKIACFNKPKVYEIKLTNISHLIDREYGLEIVPKGKNGEIHYKGDETEYFHERNQNSILIRLNGSKSEGLRKNLFNILKKEVPLIKHPNLDYLFLPL